jgi:4-hydroxy-4-methyl-2-oxoglutarate aldolase
MKATATPLTPEQLEALRRLDACTLANAIETFHERLRNEGFVDHSIRSIFPRLQPMVGFAATIKIRGSEPSTAGGIYPDRTDWWDYILSVPAPRVIVVLDCAPRPGMGSLLGTVHTNIVRALGCVGAVTNGSVRDIPALESLAFPVFAGSICVSHAYIHILEMGETVEIGGLKIKSGICFTGIFTASSPFRWILQRRCRLWPPRLSSKKIRSAPCASHLDFRSKNSRRLFLSIH